MDRVRALATAINKGLDEGAWGMIDPWIFKLIADGLTGSPEEVATNEISEETAEDIKAMCAVLTQVVKEIH